MPRRMSTEVLLGNHCTKSAIEAPQKRNSTISLTNTQNEKAWPQILLHFLTWWKSNKKALLVGITSCRFLELPFTSLNRKFKYYTNHYWNKRHSSWLIYFTTYCKTIYSNPFLLCHTYLKDEQSTIFYNTSWSCSFWW